MTRLIARWLLPFRTVRVRLTLWYVALLALILLAFSGALYLALTQGLHQQLDDLLVLDAHDLVGRVDLSIGQPHFSQEAGAVAGLKAIRARGFLVRLLDERGQVVDSNPGFDELPAPDLEQLAGRPGQSLFATYSVQGEAYRAFALAIANRGQTAGALQIARSLEGIDTPLQQLSLALTAIVPLSLIVAAALGVFLAGRALAPVDQITRAAQRISAQDMSQRLDFELPDDELGRLARTFDAMLARLDDAFRREHEFTANAAHELRTPLTVMRGEIDVALQRPRSAAEYQATLGELGADVERLTRLSEDLLMLARADAHQLPVSHETLNAAQILEATADEFRALAEARQLRLEVTNPRSVEFWGDESKALRVLSNLVENALKFSPAGSRVCLSADREDGWAVLTVSDNGPGIPAEDLPHIFERFYRGQPGRAEGAGLGLAIARALVVVQGGGLTVTSEPAQGTTCVVKLPLFPTPAGAADVPNF